MAFFGLTRLGPQNSFHEALRARSKLNIFEAAEFETAFAQVGRDGDVRLAQVPEVFEILYRGPAPPADVERCEKHLPKTSLVSRDEFLKAVKNAQLEEEEWAAKEGERVSGEFSSGVFYRECNIRHKRMNDDPAEKYNQPVTAAMEIGWTRPSNLEPPKAAKKSCDETVYAAELIKAGVYF